MSIRNLFRLPKLSAVTLLIAFVLSPPVRGEFTVGERIPPFALTAPDGMTIEAAFDGDRLAITRGDATVKPSVTVVHLLQPDCLQCRAQLLALKQLRADAEDPAVAFLGIAHRGEPAALAKLAEALDVGFPMVTGVGSDVADRFAAGDTLGILDEKGVVRFAQVGYAQGDEALWRDAIEAIRAGRPVTRSGVDLERLAVGDVMPAVTLPSLRTGEPMALVGEGGRLAFHQADREPVHPEAAVGFFSRYWAFSREEMVHLQKFHEKYGDKGLLVFVISMHPDPDGARELTDELDVTYPVFNGHKSDLGKLYAYGWPAFIIDAGGVIRHTQVGFESGDEKKYEQVIKGLLK